MKFSMAALLAGAAFVIASPVDKEKRDIEVKYVGYDVVTPKVFIISMVFLLKNS